MNNCENCIHNAVCDMANRFVEAFADNNGICTDYKDRYGKYHDDVIYEIINSERN